MNKAEHFRKHAACSLSRIGWREGDGGKGSDKVLRRLPVPRGPVLRALVNGSADGRSDPERSGDERLQAKMQRTYAIPRQ